MRRAQQRAAAASDADAGISAAELDAQSAELQRVLARRRHRAAVLDGLRAQHAANAQPLPLWLSLCLVALLLFGVDYVSQRLWGLEEVVVPIKDG